MGVVIESHLTGSPAFILVKSDKYNSLYKAILVDLASDTTRVKQHVDAAFARIMKQEEKFAELGELFPEAEVETIPEDRPEMMEPEPTTTRRPLHRKRGK